MYKDKKNLIRIIALTLLSCILFLNGIYAQDTKDTISIISFNDFHGKFIQDKGVPGAARLVGMVKSLQQKHKNSIVVCGGDNFSGDIFSYYTRGKLLKPMFDAMKVEVSAIGNHEFDWGLKYLKDTMAVTIPLIGANIEDKDMQQNSPWMRPYYISERMLSDGKPFRIAFIGITTTTTPQGSKMANLKGIRFTDPVDAVQRQLINLRKEKPIDMVVVLMHSGISMDIPYPIRDKDTEMLPFLSGISAIIAGHSHILTYDKINNVPVIQADAYTVGVNELHFQIRNHNGMRDISYIGMDTLKSSNAIPDKAIKTLIDNEAQRYGFYDRLTFSKDVLIHDANINPYDYTAPGAYVSMSYAHAYKKLHPEIKIPVVGANHYGGIRSSFSKGEINYLHALNILPFGGKVIAYQFTGASLARLLTIGRTTAKNYLQTSNLTFHVDKHNTVDRIWYQNKEINPSDRCIVVLDSYIADGSDGYDASLFAHPLETIGITTKLFTAYLKTLPEISLKRAPLPVVKHD